MRRHPARRSSCSLKGLLASPSSARGASSASSSAARVGPCHAARLPAGEVLGAGEVVEVENQRQPVLGQVARHGRGRRELVDGDVTLGGVLGVHPVLEGLGGQVVVDGLGEDLRAPARLAQGVAQLERVRPRCVVRVEGRDELVDGHRPPGGGAHRSGGEYGEVTLARTAVTRKSSPPGPGRAADGLVATLLEQPAPGVGTQRPTRREVGLERARRRPSQACSAHRVDDERPARGEPVRR